MATPHQDSRTRLLSGLPVTERRLRLAGVSTAVLEGGDGQPLVLLAAEFAAVWLRVIPDLVATHRVIAPDLPGLGASEVSDGPIDVDGALAWLAGLDRFRTSSVKATMRDDPAVERPASFLEALRIVLRSGGGGS
jgi:pimeloyl-ACP methyl ester carboxylesterase